MRLTEILFLIFISLGTYYNAFASNKPPTSIILKNQCDYEICNYGKHWRVAAELNPPPLVNVFSDQEMKNKVATLKPNETFFAIEGEMRGTPLKMTVVTAFTGSSSKSTPEGNYKVGDNIYLLNYQGEGLFGVWIEGKTNSIDAGYILDPKGFLKSFISSKCLTPSKDCIVKLEEGPIAFNQLVKIKTKSGKVGWIKGEAYLDSGAEDAGLSQ